MEEIFIARALEKKYRKNEIIEFYLNNIYFGHGYYGIQSASSGYFSRSVDELSLSQIAFLCAIPNNPTLYDPLTNMDNTLARRNRILENMAEDGKISRRASIFPPPRRRLYWSAPRLHRKTVCETYAYYCATRALMEQSGFAFRYSFATEAEREAYDESYDALSMQSVSRSFTRAATGFIHRLILRFRMSFSRRLTMRFPDFRMSTRRAFMNCRHLRCASIMKPDMCRRW